MNEFKDRFARACRDHPDVPPFNRGQQKFIARSLGVSQEAVRKWFYGESKPKAPLARKLADLLEVDYLWLIMGTELGEIEVRKVAAQRQDAAVYAFMAFLIDQGHSAAFEQSDSGVDIASISGGSLNHYVVRAAVSVEETMTVSFPSSNLAHCSFIVAIKTNSSNLSFDFLVLDSDTLNSESETTGVSSVLRITNPSKGEYFAGGIKIPSYLKRQRVS